MISKCSTVILNKRKFSEFEDGDLNDKSLYIVGYQDIDGERVNVKINISDLLDKRNGDQVFVIDDTMGDDGGCASVTTGDPSGFSVMTCGGQRFFIFDTAKTGSYIQINKINTASWSTRQDSRGQMEHYINIAFTNTKLGCCTKLYLPNFGKNASYADDGYPCRVYLFQIDPETMTELSDAQCAICDTSAGQRVSRIINSFPIEQQAGQFDEEGKMKRQYYDYFVRFITLTSEYGIKLTRAVEVTNIYDGNWDVDDSDPW